MRLQDLLPSLDELAHHAVRQAFETLALRPTDSGPMYAVDATAGNGRDTLFLAELLSNRGMVYAFDVQDEALNAAQARLDTAGLGGCVRPIRAGHETAARHLPEEARGRVIAVMFNLGFLPGSDKRVITRTETTLAALKALVPFLAPRAVITLHLYTGHAGGTEESTAVSAWAEHLDRNVWRVLRCSQHNKPHRAEHLLLIEKRSR